LEDRLIKVRELLAVRGAGRLETLSAEQASLVRTSSHYWLDKEDGRLYKKNTENNGLQLVVVEENRMRLLKSWDIEVHMRQESYYNRDSGGQE